MIWFPELPSFDGDYFGILDLPETIEYDEEEKTDFFLQALLESLSRPLRGGTHG